MKFEEAIKLLKEGKKVKRRGWDYHWYLIPNAVGDISIKAEVNSRFDDGSYHRTTYLTIENIEADDWEVYDDSDELGPETLSDKEFASVYKKEDVKEAVRRLIKDWRVNNNGDSAKVIKEIFGEELYG